MRLMQIRTPIISTMWVSKLHTLSGKRKRVSPLAKMPFEHELVVYLICKACQHPAINTSRAELVVATAVKVPKLLFVKTMDKNKYNPFSCHGEHEVKIRHTQDRTRRREETRFSPKDMVIAAESLSLPLSTEEHTTQTDDAVLSWPIASCATSITTLLPTKPCAYVVNAYAQKSNPSNPYNVVTCPSRMKITLRSQVESILNPISSVNQTPTYETAAIRLFQHPQWKLIWRWKKAWTATVEANSIVAVMLFSPLFHLSASLLSPLFQATSVMASLSFSPVKHPASITEYSVPCYRVLHSHIKVSIIRSASGYDILSSYIFSSMKFWLADRNIYFISEQWNPCRDMLCFYIAMRFGKEHIHML